MSLFPRLFLPMSDGLERFLQILTDAHPVGAYGFGVRTVESRTLQALRWPVRRGKNDRTASGPSVPFSFPN